MKRNALALAALLFAATLNPVVAQKTKPMPCLEVACCTPQTCCGKGQFCPID